MRLVTSNDNSRFEYLRNFRIVSLKYGFKFHLEST